MLTLGLRLGASEGWSVGLRLGLCDGASVGDTVGLTDGRSVGEKDTVGALEWVTVGLALG